MTKSRTVIGQKGGRFHLQHNTIGDDVPIAVVLRCVLAVGRTENIHFA